MIQIAPALTFPATRRLGARLWDWTPARCVLGWLLVFSAWIPAIFLRGAADEAGMPRQRASVLAVERMIGLGETPTERLQGWFFVGHAAPWDWFFMGVHAAWFVVPELVILYVLWRHPARFVEVAAVRLGVIYVGLIGFYLVPTVPPWMALNVTRIMDLGWGDASANDTNVFAALPSHHVAVVAAMALWLMAVRLRAAAVMLTAFAALTCFGVVYLGEHYVVDVLAGVLLAIAVVRVVRLWGENST